jgi:hypothetical protein
LSSGVIETSGMVAQRLSEYIPEFTSPRYYGEKLGQIIREPSLLKEYVRKDRTQDVVYNLDTGIADIPSSDYLSKKNIVYPGYEVKRQDISSIAKFVGEGGAYLIPGFGEFAIVAESEKSLRGYGYDPFKFAKTEPLKAGLLAAPLVYAGASKGYKFLNEPIRVNVPLGYKYTTRLDEFLGKSFARIKEGQERVNFIDEQLIKLNIPINDNNRCEFVMGNQGILGQSLRSIIDAINSGYESKLHFVEYDDLIKNPNDTLVKLYSFLGEDFFQHSFDNIKNEFREKDLETYGLSDMHEVRKKLVSIAPNPKEILSNEILQKFSNFNYWRKENQKIIGIGQK